MGTPKLVLRFLHFHRLLADRVGAVLDTVENEVAEHTSRFWLELNGFGASSCS